MNNVLNILSLGDLLLDVQVQRVFADQKTFVDCIPRFPVEAILEKYHVAKYGADFDLKRFVSENFEVPKALNEGYSTDTSQSIVEHISELWNILTRTSHEEYSTLMPLPYPFVVPGGRFGEIYYWDSYFTMLGLRASGRMDLVQAMVDNFTYLIKTVGHIPNGNRSYFISRSQPPFYAHMIDLLREEKGDGILKKYLPALLKEYAYWMGGSDGLSANRLTAGHTVRMPDGEVLNRYWDEENTPRPEGYAIDRQIQKAAKNNPELYRDIRAACESGWDFSSRWFADGVHIETICTTEIVPVDLNCLLWHLETTIAQAYVVNNERQKQDLFERKALLRRNAIEKYCWCVTDNIYKDYNHVLEQPTGSIHLAMAYPLFAGIADTTKARQVLHFIENNMLANGGLITTTTATKQQWDSPKGWAPLQWIVYTGAKKYGCHTLRKAIRDTWCTTVEKEFAVSGKLLEKYNVCTDNNKEAGGEYANQDGFGWTNGVYLVMKNDDT